VDAKVLLQIVCLIIAGVCFFIGTWWNPAPRGNLVSAGLFFVTLALLIGVWP
jgi:hypothetical protein